MNVALNCGNCGSANLRVRTSEKIGLLTVDIIGYCNNCGSKHEIVASIKKVSTPIYQERPEVLRINKPLMKVDLNTEDLFEEK